MAGIFLIGEQQAEGVLVKAVTTDRFDAFDHILPQFSGCAVFACSSGDSVHAETPLAPAPTDEERERISKAPDKQAPGRGRRR